MATTKLWKVTTNLGDVIDYAKNLDKTEQELYISGINCSSDFTYEEMKATKESFNKTDGILAFHGYQSFAGGEVSPEIAHEIGLKLANEMWGDKYEVLVSTHLNTNHIHNHFVINSVSFIDGKKYNSCKRNTAELRRINDLICEEYGLNVLKEKMTKNSKINFNNFRNSEINYENYYQIVKKEIDLAITESVSFCDFENLLTQMGYDHYIRYGKLTVRRYDYKRNVRLEKQFDDSYSVDNIERRIIESEPSHNILEEETIKRYYKIDDKKHYHGFIGLYRYYCYLLKVYPKNIRKYKLSFSMRNDIQTIDQISKETVFLVDNKINTQQELIDTRLLLMNEKKSLMLKRDILWQEYKKSPSIELEKEMKQIKKGLDIINNKIELTYSIERRVKTISTNLEEYKKENEKGVISRESIK